MLRRLILCATEETAMISAENKRVAENKITEMLIATHYREELKLVRTVTRFHVIIETRGESNRHPAKGKLLFEHSAEPSVTGVTSDAPRCTGCIVGVFTDSNRRLFQTEKRLKMGWFPFKSFPLFLEVREKGNIY